MEPQLLPCTVLCHMAGFLSPPPLLLVWLPPSLGLTPSSLFLFYLFRATPTTYGCFHARGLIRASPASLHHSHSIAGLNCVCYLHHSSQKHQILNPLSETRDQTHILMDTSQVCDYCTTKGTPAASLILVVWGNYFQTLQQEKLCIIRSSSPSPFPSTFDGSSVCQQSHHQHQLRIVCGGFAFFFFFFFFFSDHSFFLPVLFSWGFVIVVVVSEWTSENRQQRGQFV